ncbi:hypothetical protein SUGI_0845190 [Cryptomeria japonica]|nr:hypothetical protein SUGI_0845190 [Cryptomeria japonica]
MQADLYPCKGVDDEVTIDMKLKAVEDQQVISLAVLDIECILEKQLLKKSCRKEYVRYLVRWRNHPLEDASWLSASEISAYGHPIDDLMSQSS